MKRSVVVVCMVVGFWGLLCAMLGFTMEATRVKVSDVQTIVPGDCVYPRSPALAVGLTAAVALMMAQAIMNTVTGCLCCKRHLNTPNTNWTVALISFIINW